MTGNIRGTFGQSSTPPANAPFVILYPVNFGDIPDTPDVRCLRVESDPAKSGSDGPGH
jgi:hypothetical protein